ncbi:MAG: nickel pincer cofactor biosynthesis protein LarB [Peptostreptococcaceae bacterium]|nr:nickel pincer cofactor biosynthesis protein LarB [Peptostreptococcaceae bacterium]
MDMLTLLQAVADGKKTPEEALLELKMQPFDKEGFEDIGFARLDTHRKIRQGTSEVIFGEGKTVDQIRGILQRLQGSEKNILVTRLSEEKANALAEDLELQYHPQARIAVVDPAEQEIEQKGYILVITAGTSDIPVAEEAAVTAEALGNEVKRLYDVGVAGLHRLLAELPTIMQARVIVAVAGMEGALVSVVGGLSDRPVIAVPTGIGYGANMQGVTTLLSMLSSCASGVSVVNIDNGFGAGYLASMINKM